MPLTTLGPPLQAIATALGLSAGGLGVYEQHWADACADSGCDVHGASAVTAAVAVRLLDKSGLSREDLGEIWSLVNENRGGMLTQEQFCTALKLVAMRQSQMPADLNQLTTITPLPALDFAAFDQRWGDADIG